MNKRHEELRAYFVRHYGEIKGSESIHQVWGSDPHHPELAALTSQCIDMGDDSSNLLDALAETPATSLQGIYCKLLATISLVESIDQPHAQFGQPGQGGQQIRVAMVGSGGHGTEVVQAGGL